MFPLVFFIACWILRPDFVPTTAIFILTAVVALISDEYFFLPNRRREHDEDGDDQTAEAEQRATILSVFVDRVTRMLHVLNDWIIRPVAAFIIDIVKREGPTEMFFLLAVTFVATCSWLKWDLFGSWRETPLVAFSILFAVTHLPPTLLKLFQVRQQRNASLIFSFLRTIAIGVLCCAATMILLDRPLTAWSWKTVGWTRSTRCSIALTSSLATQPPVTIITDRLYHLETLGDVPVVYPSLLLLYMVGRLFVTNERRRLFLTLPLIAMVYTGMLSGAVKLLVHRQRPSIASTPFAFSGPSSSWQNVEGFSKTDLSFPSGHVAVTTAVGRCLLTLYLQQPTAALISLRHQASGRGRVMMPSNTQWRRIAIVVLCLAITYFASCAVSVGRFSQCFHWPSDCLFGAFFGVAVADILVLAPLKPEKHDNTTPIFPSLSFAMSSVSPDPVA